MLMAMHVRPISNDIYVYKTIKMLRYYDYYYCFYHKHKNKLIKLTLNPPERKW